MQVLNILLENLLIELAKNGTSIIVISQDLDELFEISHRISVIFNGKLSKSYETNKYFNFSNWSY